MAGLAGLADSMPPSSRALRTLGVAEKAHLCGREAYNLSMWVGTGCMTGRSPATANSIASSFPALLLPADGLSIPPTGPVTNRQRVSGGGQRDRINPCVDLSYGQTAETVS